jgi:glycosyltransferase involved in cell wall biosynthesis
MKIFTATPMPFFKTGESEDRFFSRDTGLLCQQFQKDGHESKVVMLDGPEVQTHLDILRVSLADMESAEWWKQFGLDAVVLYAWMLPRYLKIAQAIHRSGTKLISRCDSTGLYDPRVDLFEYLRQEFYGYGSEILTKNNTQRCLRTVLKTAYRLVNRSYQHGVIDFADCCDEMLIESTLAKERMQKFFKLYHRPDLAERVCYEPHPIDVKPLDQMIRKEKLILAVGRWDDYIKNGPLMVHVLVRVLKLHPEYRAVVTGSGFQSLEETVQKAGMGAAIQFTGRLSHDEVLEWMRKAQIVLVTSRYESFNMVAAEARCFGSSVVGSAHLPSIRDFAGRDGGTASSRYSVGAFVAAVQAEIAAWERGGRGDCSI